MSLLDMPGVEPRLLIEAQPVRLMPAADPDRDNPVPTPIGDPVAAFPQNQGSTRSFVTGVYNNVSVYLLWVDLPFGEEFPVSEKDWIWFEAGGDLNPDGTPDYNTAYEIQSLIHYQVEGYASIECSRTR